MGQATLEFMSSRTLANVFSASGVGIPVSTVNDNIPMSKGSPLSSSGSQDRLSIHKGGISELSSSSNAASGSQYLTSSGEGYVPNPVRRNSAEVNTESPLDDSQNNPGMGLLLSLSDKLTANMPSGALETPTSASDVKDPLPTVFIPPVLTPTDPSANLTPLAESSDSPSLPATGASMTSTFPTFDHQSHLDTIATAASAAAATQYNEARAFQVKHTNTSAPTGSDSLPLHSAPAFSYEDPATTAYLSASRQSTLHVPRLSLSTPKSPDNFSAFDFQKLMPSTTSVASVSFPTSFLDPTRDASMSATASGAPLPNVAKGASTLPASLDCHGVLDEDASQQKVIEEAVQSLNAQHELAQTAALHHHQQKLNVSLGLSLRDAPSAPLNDVMASIVTYPSTDLSKKVPLIQPTKPQACEVKSLADTERGSHESRTTSDPTQKRFQCPKCSRAFARAYNLNTHMSTHDPDPSRSKPFPCPYRSCRAEGGRSFSRKHDLQRHVASVHEMEPEPGILGDSGEMGEGQETGGLASLGLGTPGKKFRCEQCGRAFVRRDALRRHHCDKDTARPMRKPAAFVPEKQNSSYAVGGFSGQVMHQVAMHLMQKTDGESLATESSVYPHVPSPPPPLTESDAKDKPVHSQSTPHSTVTASARS